MSRRIPIFMLALIMLASCNQEYPAGNDKTYTYDRISELVVGMHHKIHP